MALIGANGGLIGSQRSANTGTAPGLWTANEQVLLRRAATWPVTGDPNFSSVSLLLHMDGTNGSTTFTDSSSNALTVTRSGDAQISTTQSKFGGASAYFDGTGDYLSSASSAGFAFGTGNFTCEAWIYPTAFGGTYNTIMATRGGSGTVTGFSWSAVSNGTMIVYTNTFAYQGTVTSAISLNTWTHIALVRSAGNLQVYINGVKNRASDVTFTNDLTDQTFTVGIVGTFEPFTGYIDDLRITKGIARYTTDFTAPVAAFPDA